MARPSLEVALSCCYAFVVTKAAKEELVLELPAARPFLKWVGGKGQLLGQLRPLLPEVFGRYFEPFVGGAALFFAMRPGRASLRDVNDELIDCYRAIRDHVDDVIEALGAHHYDREHFYRVRDLEPKRLSLVERAARTIFLNKTGFNGLYRVNRSGKFNVPFGRHKNPSLGDPNELKACSLALRGVELIATDFTRIEADTQPGDFVYFDPPYFPLSATSDFTTYAAGGFGVQDQKRLAELFAALTRKGVYAMLSNSSAPEVRSLYAKYRITEVLASRNVNARTSGRGKVAELVIRNYAPASERTKSARNAVR